MTVKNGSVALGTNEREPPPLPHQLNVLNSATPTRGLVARDDKGRARFASRGEARSLREYLAI